MARPTHRAYRWNLVLTAILLVLGLGFLNAIAKHSLAIRSDWTEDGLASLDPATAKLLGTLEDVLAVEAFFTANVEHGPVQVAKSRLADQLRAMEARARGRLKIQYRDPNTSTETRLEATRFGIEPVPVQATQGTADVVQDLYLGVVLRYRGRERVLPFVLPQNFEYLFTTELERLIREVPPTVGFVDRDVSMGSDSAAGLGFQTARALLATNFNVVPVNGLAEGKAVAEKVEVLVLARPIALHPRAVFEIDQFVQRGGRLLVLADHTQIDATGAVQVFSMGTEAMLAAWGVGVERGHVWDQSCNPVTQTREVTVDGRRQSIPAGQIRYPYWVRVDEGGLERSIPATGTLGGADFFWCHALSEGAAPEGVEVTDLVRTSERSWIAEEVRNIGIDAAHLNARAAEFLAQADGAQRVLVRSVRGPLPSPFAESGAPSARDLVDDARWRRSRDAALEAEEPVPDYPVSFGADPVLSGEESAHVIVVGDADWMDDGASFTDRNHSLLMNLVGWLALGDELLTLRARLPRERKIADFEAEERERVGLGAVMGTEGWDESQRRTQLESEARSRASSRRWWRMLATTGGALAMLGVVFVATRRAGVPRVGGEQ